jgi:hypothetical protein
LHLIIKQLISENKIEKIGSAPKVYFVIKENGLEKQISIAPLQEEFLNKHFIWIDALGNLLTGLSAMEYWCTKQNLALQKTIDEYIVTKNKYLAYYKNDVIDGLEKLKSTKGIGTIATDNLFYLDFYDIERFGKTRLGTLMHYAKQGQNKILMDVIVKEIKNRINYLAEQLQIDAIVYVPPTIKRTTQIMTYLEKKLAIPLPILKVQKINNPIIIPQKALNNIFERVANANKTFMVPVQKNISMY